MIQDFLDYLRLLATQHRSFNHSEDNVAYYEVDWTGFSSLKKRNEHALFVHKMDGMWGHNRGDSHREATVVHFIIFTKVGTKEMKASTAKYLECHAFAKDFLRRIWHDREEGGEDLCELLRYARLEAVEFEQTELSADGWLGCEVRLPFATNFDIDFDPAKWNIPEPDETP